MQPHHYISVEEYLELDLKADGSPAQNGVKKYEYHAGEVFAMAGESWPHALIRDNVAQSVRSRMTPDTCRTLNSEMRVRVEESYTYPDIVLVCGQADLTDERPPSIQNPLLIVEVLSGSTRSRDKDWKMKTYFQIRTLNEYWLLEQTERLVLQCHRMKEEWGLRFLSGVDAVLTSDEFKLEIPIREFYRGLDL